jgi:hypothetical protein
VQANGPVNQGSTFRGLEGLTFLRSDGNGFLYRARHAALGRTTLLRVLPVGPEPDAALVEGFLERARRLSALEHPHVAQVYDFGREGELLYLSMEGGEGLASGLEGHPSETARFPLSVLKGVAFGLAALHAQGIAHGGVAFDAVHRDADGAVRLSDFSLVPGSAPEGDSLAADLSALEGMLGPEVAARQALEGPGGAAAVAGTIDRLCRRRRRNRLALRGSLIGTLGAALLAVLLPGSRIDPRENILGRIDLERDVVHGSWEFEGTALWCRSEEKVPRVQIPVPVPEEYDLVLEGLRLYPPPARSAPGQVVIGLLFGGRQASVHLDVHTRDGFRSGLGLIDERQGYENESTRAGRVLSADRPHSVVCVVRRGALRVRVDGRTIIDWRGDFRRLSLPSVRWVPRKDVLIFAVSRARGRLEAMHVVPHVPGRESPQGD